MTNFEKLFANMDNSSKLRIGMAICDSLACEECPFQNECGDFGTMAWTKCHIKLAEWAMKEADDLSGGIRDFTDAELEMGIGVH